MQKTLATLGILNSHNQSLSTIPQPQNLDVCMILILAVITHTLYYTYMHIYVYMKAHHTVTNIKKIIHQLYHIPNELQTREPKEKTTNNPRIFHLRTRLGKSLNDQNYIKKILLFSSFLSRQTTKNTRHKMEKLKAIQTHTQQMQIY